MAERATKKRTREPIVPWGDVDLAAVASPSDKTRVELAMRAFDCGDYALLRALARELRSSSDAAVRAAGDRFAARLAVDPVQVWTIVACTMFLVLVALRFVLRT